MKIIMLILMFFIVGALFIISEKNLALKSNEDLTEFKSLYVGWLSGIFENVKSVSGSVIKMDWLPD